jgi:hypothetical protein
VSLKNPVTPPGIDPVTVRLVAQCLNHYATAGPHYKGILSLNRIDPLLSSSIFRLNSYRSVNKTPSQVTRRQAGRQAGNVLYV